MEACLAVDRRTAPDETRHLGGTTIESKSISNTSEGPFGDRSTPAAIAHESGCRLFIHDDEDGLWCVFCGFEQRATRARRRKLADFVDALEFVGESEHEPRHPPKYGFEAADGFATCLARLREKPGGCPASC